MTHIFLMKQRTKYSRFLPKVDLCDILVLDGFKIFSTNNLNWKVFTIRFRLRRSSSLGFLIKKTLTPESKKTGPNSFKLKVLGALIIGIIIYNGICIFIIASSKSFKSFNPHPLWALTISYHVMDISFYLVTVAFILKVNRDTFKECLIVRFF